jgi:NAD(P)-dependent dehydrogenase (short-subunit alcohol dehydrogenase family)
VALESRNEQRLRETLDLMPVGAHLVQPMDLSDLERIPSGFSEVIEKTGPLDGLVHSAGMTSLHPLRTMTTSHLEDVMRVNYYAAVSLCKEFCGKRGHQPRGASVVLVASLAGILGLPAQSAYCGSKGAVIAFARAAAIELAKRKIRVNCVAPGPVRTEMLDVFSRVVTAEQHEAHVQAPLGMGTPLDVAYAITFLLAETSTWITGSVLTVDGGYSVQS